MIINFDVKNNKFLIQCKPDENSIVMGLPDRRFRKGTRVWVAPALRRNLEYMSKHMNNTSMYSKEALAVYNGKREEHKAPPPGENVFPDWFRFKNPPKPHQFEHMKRAFVRSAFAFFFEQGLGKTYTTINLGAAWRMTNNIDAVVVVCPSSIKLVWEDEIKEHSPIPAQVHLLESGKYKKCDAFIENKTDFQWLIVGIEALSQGNGGDYMRRFLMSRRCMVVVDESSTIKTPNTLRTDKCIKHGWLGVKRLILSGTSITQGLEDLYTQFKFLDPEIIGLDSYYTFRANYCVTINITVGYDQYGNERTTPKIIGYKNEEEFFGLIAPYTARVEKKDVWADMPEKIYTNRYVQMNPEQKRIYKEMDEDMYIEMENAQPDDKTTIAWYEYEAKGILEKTMRLLQITGGHYPYDDGVKVKPVAIPGKNPKIAELIQILNEVPGKIIVWCCFRPEIELISQVLESKLIPYVEFHGGCDQESKTSAVRSFRADPKIRVFLATRAAARGLTLVEASTCVYYSTSPSLDDYEQSQDRIHRYGQDRGCNYIHLICQGTRDKIVFDSLRDKKNVAQLAYDIIKEKMKTSKTKTTLFEPNAILTEAEQALIDYERWQ